MFDRDEPKDVEITPELAAVERQLAALAVAPLQVDRDCLMFEAGRAAGRAECTVAATLRVAGTPHWLWPSAAAMMTAACVLLAAMLVWRDDAALVVHRDAKPQAVGSPGTVAATEEVREMERRDVDARPWTWPTRPQGGYLEQRYIALTRGVGEVRSNGDGGSSTDSIQPATARELLRDLMPPDVSSPQSRS